MVRGDSNERAMQQARCEGYTMCLADFESMGQPTITGEAIEAEFQEEHISESDLAPFKASGNKTA